MSDIDFWPRTLYFPVERDDWRAIHEALEVLPLTVAVERIQATLDVIEQRARERFAMTVWSFADIYGAAARLRGLDVGYMDEATLEQSGLTSDQVDEIATIADSPLIDRMTERGWDVLEYVVEEYFCEHGIPVPEDDEPRDE
jgi:hypothetical protein